MLFISLCFIVIRSRNWEIFKKSAAYFQPLWTKSVPGTEPVAEAAAALAAGAIIFREVDTDYADRALGHALELFEFADKFRKEYHWSIPQVSDFYKSWSGYKDELCWAAS